MGSGSVGSVSNIVRGCCVHFTFLAKVERFMKADNSEHAPIAANLGMFFCWA